MQCNEWTNEWLHNHLKRQATVGIVNTWKEKAKLQKIVSVWENIEQKKKKNVTRPTEENKINAEMGKKTNALKKKMLKTFHIYCKL